MKAKTINQKHFVPYISAREIDLAVQGVADRLNGVYDDSSNLLCLCVLNGAFMYVSDLMKKLDFDCEVSFVKYASYEGVSSSGTLNSLIGLNESVVGRNILLIDDIVDTGMTLSKIKTMLLDAGAAKVAVSAMIYKPHTCNVDVVVDYPGIVMKENGFIVGYGLDYNGKARHYPEIYRLEEE